MNCAWIVCVTVELMSSSGLSRSLRNPRSAVPSTEQTAAMGQEQTLNGYAAIVLREYDRARQRGCRWVRLVETIEH